MGKTAAKRAYEFFSNKRVTHGALISGPVNQTIELCARETTVLLIQDTTAPSFGGRAARTGLGPINDAPSAQGMLVHTCLAVTESGRVLGIAAQKVWTRSREKKDRDETPAERKARERESQRWPEMASAVHKEFTANGVRAKLIHVGDREADIFALFEAVADVDDSFVYRATYDRRTTEKDGASRIGSLQAAERSPVLARKTIAVPARPGCAARVARLEIRATRVEVCVPKNEREKRPPVWMNVVIVSELDPPSAKRALRWNLLTREPIDSAEAVLRIANIYAQRWVIEDFHMGLKTGCALEQRQFESCHALSNFLAVASAIAVHALQLRDAARDETVRPATDVLSPLQLKLLRNAAPRLKADCTAYEAWRAVASLGGFFDTSRKAMPGWRTLYGGMQILLEREAGYRLALEELRASHA